DHPRHEPRVVQQLTIAAHGDQRSASALTQELLRQDDARARDTRSAPEQWNLKSSRRRGERQHLAVKCRLLPRELERGKSGARVEIALSHGAYPRYTVSACHSRNSRPS